MYDITNWRRLKLEGRVPVTSFNGEIERRSWKTQTKRVGTALGVLSWNRVEDKEIESRAPPLSGCTVES
ncbi:hypothetical protein RchiOBHm_Chr6g0252311 [Rosa chinensis]|uniref:Uncharacterized protein n=1 Tax=Rosa chinensis TaxID=74649 RepID=A0A2P6PL17_ROSCH|nr:hypothetical protein RchiOBHm_Chr6g0252311 [Rosa chinensis]